MAVNGRSTAVRRITTGLGSVLLLASIGCGADPTMPKLGKVYGTVSYHGKPVDAGHIVFTPVAGKGGETGQTATGEIESDGTYTMTTFNTGDGAILGQHVVTVTVREKGTEAYPKPKPSGAIDYKLPKSLAPKRYETADKSPLRCTVLETGTKFDIELKD
jgi:hypothetical protein